METFSTRLSVNVNKIATLRNARGGARPCPVKAAKHIQQWGADGITVHPRPDARHITFEDVRRLREVVTSEFNIEGYPSPDFMELVLDVKPEQVTLVPDPPGILTSNAGWNTITHAQLLKEVVGRLREAGIRTSLFVGTDMKHIEGAAASGSDRIELYSGPYAEQYFNRRDEAVSPFVTAARYANECGLGINAGHDLNLENLRFFMENVVPLHEVSIGHALISDALYVGLQNAVGQYKEQLRPR